MRNVSTEQVLQWKAFGAYYGYPSCCIDAFCNRPLGCDSPEQDAVHNDNGFIPCQEHALMILTGKIKIEQLITDRICKSSYPDSGNHKSLFKFLDITNNSIPP